MHITHVHWVPLECLLATASPWAVATLLHLANAKVHKLVQPDADAPPAAGQLPCQVPSPLLPSWLDAGPPHQALSPSARCFWRWCGCACWGHSRVLCGLSWCWDQHSDQGPCVGCPPPPALPHTSQPGYPGGLPPGRVLAESLVLSSIF